MNKTQWNQIEQLIDQALEFPPDERTSFIHQNCDADEILRNEVQSLLQSGEEAFTFIQGLETNIVSPSISKLASERFDEKQRVDTVVDHYQITDIIGGGGMGVVYAAIDTKLDRIVALKFLPLYLTRSKKNKQRFIREAKAAAALNHPHICTIYSVDEYGGQQYISMEIIDGQTLRNTFSSEKVTSFSIVEYAIQISGALAEAHEKGIVHRDIKPDNIMVDSKNRIKVMDFGIAQLQTKSGLARERTNIGTLPYMSPEQVNGDKVDHRTDIWSMGVVLYEMIAGKRPFEGENDQAILHSILNDNPEPLNTAKNGVHEQLNNIALKCLEKNPADRYQSMDEMILDLHQVRIGFLEAQENRTTLFSKHRTRRKTIGFLTAIVVLLLVGYWFWPSSDPGTSPATIAVLPLESISQNLDTEFVDAMHQALINRLGVIGNLTVIARSSVLRYPPGERDLPTIGRELGVSSIMETTISQVNDQLRVSVQLNDVKTQNTIWSGSFAENLDNLFGIQSDIVWQVAGVLQATPTEQEQIRLNERPTQNQQAYLLYMMGRLYLGQSFYDKENLLAAEDFLSRAIEKDSKFASAWAFLAYTHSFLYLFWETTPEQLEKLKNASEQAQLLSPDLPETKMALGTYYFWSDSNNERALSYFESALNQSPNHPALHHMIAYMYRRLGNWELVFHHLKKALEYDPLNVNIYLELEWNYGMIRDFDKVLEYNFKLEELFSHNKDFRISLINFYKTGNIEEYDAFWDNYPLDPVKERPALWGDYNMLKRNWKEALRGYENIPNEVAFTQPAIYILRSALIAQVYHAQGNMTAARKYYEEAIQHLENKINQYPDELHYKMALAKIYAHMGEGEKAVRMGEEVMEATNLGGRYGQEITFIYAWSGCEEKAIDNLELALSVPSIIYRAELRLDPKWDPLRDNPRFQQLIAGKDKPYIEGL